MLLLPANLMLLQLYNKNLFYSNVLYFSNFLIGSTLKNPFLDLFIK